MASQVIHGLAYEYALARAFDSKLECGITMNPSLSVAKNAYNIIEDNFKDVIDISADDVSAFLIRHDGRFNNPHSINLQASHKGRMGDVRDIVILCRDGEIGISAKHNHYAIKHPRLSNSIDFGELWGNHPVSNQYWRSIKLVFDDLSEKQKRNMRFSQISNKAGVIYLPILTAFEDELNRLCSDYGREFIGKFFQYLIGRHDFYKAICDKSNRISVIESIYINGSLAWGTKWRIPERIESITRIRNSQSTLLVTFEGGWQVKFRLHSAKSLVEPSLKFDISFVGMASRVSRNEISINN